MALQVHTWIEILRSEKTNRLLPEHHDLVVFETEISAAFTLSEPLQRVKRF